MFLISSFKKMVGIVKSDFWGQHQDSILAFFGADYNDKHFETRDALFSHIAMILLDKQDIESFYTLSRLIRALTPVLDDTTIEDIFTQMQEKLPGLQELTTRNLQEKDLRQLQKRIDPTSKCWIEFYAVENETVAVKVPKKKIAAALAIKEAYAIGLTHKRSHHIVGLLGVYIDLHGLNLILENAEQGDLYELLSKTKRKFSVDEITKVVNELGKALVVVHESGLVHRDVKLENVLVMQDGTLKLADFGLACKKGEIQENVAGSTDFMPIEAFLVGGSVWHSDLYPQYLKYLTLINKTEKEVPVGTYDVASPRQDIYSFMLTVMSLTTQCTPFVDYDVGKSRVDGMLDIRLAGNKPFKRDEISNSSNSLNNVGVGIKSLVLHGMSDNPEIRPAAQQFVDATSSQYEKLPKNILAKR